MKLFEKEKKKKLSKRKKKKLRERKKIEKLLKNENKEIKEKKFSLKPFFGGIGVGIANIIPGVSGGTMMVIFNLFDKLTYSISDIFKRKATNRKKSILFLLEVLIGTGIGIIAFAKILGFTLDKIEAETIFWFMGLILFSVPIVYKNEMDENDRINILYFLIGFIIIGVLEYFNLHTKINSSDYTFNIMHIISLLALGFIGEQQ